MVPSTDLTHRRHPRLVSARYVDFEILPTSTLKGGDLKRWLVWRAILESMSQPMPPPKAKSSSARPARGARAAAQAAAMTTPANDKDDVTVDEALVGPGAFAAAVELGTLPQPYLSPSNANVAQAAQACKAHGQVRWVRWAPVWVFRWKRRSWLMGIRWGFFFAAHRSWAVRVLSVSLALVLPQDPKRVSVAMAPGGSGPHVEISAATLPSALIATCNLDPKVRTHVAALALACPQHAARSLARPALWHVHASLSFVASLGVPLQPPPCLPAQNAGNVTCHGCEPAPFSKTASVASKTNQDSGCVVYPLCGDPEALFVGVFDGHGELGHRASK